ncbi:MAG: Asp-tRNA(Asn)/Glu-tRNA(Gln) amidotransferase subunit GatB [Mycoplasma sp.]|nr:Asp-tRNA(Asn)/Glu-tRNA(Gln) amidotransferase subunit GatB [Mycoplasma sp.]MDY4544877.1 Asp-tRNA(Asn)/Glu-tRNA(Gln) amidotransferase subunit GatB [Bacilli bacterium]MDY4619382.1 Asp-tRNA(Asn)/Glu-tRNA(Gln) amidotransferase subunit GatB [Bacilli bacterium]
MTKLVIGLEMHAEMKSTTKVFSPSSNVYNKMANVNINEIDLAFPGFMPSLNEECVKKAVEMALILKCDVAKYMIFDRKNYYYPDLPKGYQITQNTRPVGINGNLEVSLNGSKFNVEILDIHLEEDAAALDHLPTFSLIDYNRAGVPLLETVTAPCMHSADEAIAFLETMCRIYKYTGISEADTKKGQIRCDVNVNLMDDNGNYITPKVEIKNVNSLANVKLAILYEEKRQLESLKNNEPLYQETRRFDETSGTTVHMRSKADAIDYKYFVEPNIPPYEITDEFVENIRKTIPVLADIRKDNYMNNLGLDEYNANILIKDINIANYFEKCVEVGIKPIIAANYINGIITSYINEKDININDFYLKPEYLKQINDAKESGILSSKGVKEVFYKSLEEEKEPKNFISKEDAQVSDENLIESIIDRILSSHEKEILEYKNGRTNIFDFFVGQVMKETKGKANPIITKDLLHKKLD